MVDVKNVADIIKTIENLSLAHPGFEFAVEMPEQQQQYFADVSKALTDLVPEIPDSMLVFNDEQKETARIYLEGIIDAVNRHDSVQLNGICAELANQFQVESYEDPDGCGCQGGAPNHDPDCLAVYISFMWWMTLRCVPRIQCIVKHAALIVQRDRIQLGHCDTQGGPVCKCFPISFSLLAIMILISIITLFIGGPLLGAAGREFLRQLLIRLAPIADATS